MLTRAQKNIRKRWVEKLRSGEFKQGDSCLRKVTKTKNGQKETFCCLGVLCELAVKARVINKASLEETQDGDLDNTTSYRYDGEKAFLPRDVRLWAGLKSDRGEFDEGDLSEMNDDGVSFKRIAKVIEENDTLFE